MTTPFNNGEAVTYTPTTRTHTHIHRDTHAPHTHTHRGSTHTHTTYTPTQARFAYTFSETKPCGPLPARNRLCSLCTLARPHTHLLSLTPYSPPYPLLIPPYLLSPPIFFSFLSHPTHPVLRLRLTAL